MDKSLLLGLPILLCSFRVLSGSFLNKDYAHAIYHVPANKHGLPEIIQCRMCHFQFPGDICFKGRGICTAEGEETCAIGRIFKKNGLHWLTFRGCLKNCANVDRIQWGIYLVDMRCCRSHDLCNEFLGHTGLTDPPDPMMP